MASGRTLNIAIILTAYDRATRVLREATSAQEKRLRDMRKASQQAFGEGLALTGSGAAILASMKPAVDAYRQLEDAQTTLKSSMMQAGGTVAAEFDKIDQLAQKLGNRLPGTTADFYNMFEVMLNQGIPAQTILDGVGESAAYLAVALKMPYDEAGKLASKLKEATGTANTDMMKFMDTIARVRNMGVDTQEMQYAFGRSAGALKLMNIQGLEASKSIAAVYATLIRTGMSGETVGTGFGAVFNNILNAKKMAEANAEARKLGVSLEFMDKAGQFKGVENMIAQLDKLRDYTAEQRAAVVNALTGGGQDAAMLQTLITNGVSGFSKMQRSMAGQATLNQKVTSQLGTLSNVWEATTGTITNMLAKIGKAIAPELKKVADLIGKAAEMFGKWMDNNPKFAKFLALTVSGIGIMLMVVGVIKLIRGAMIALNIVMAMNPFVLIAMAAIAAAMLIYTYWDDIVAFFRNMWSKIKGVFSDGWNWVKTSFLNYTPIGWVIKYWGPLTEYFSQLWNSIKQKFQDFWDYVTGFPRRMYEAGKNIIKSLWEGIKEMANKPIEAIREIVQKIRDHLPFSPAKIGPLRDIHRIKLVETIAQNVKPGPLVNAMNSVAGATMQAANGPTFSSAGGGGFSLTYSPNITIGGNANKADFEDLLRKHKNQITRMVEQALQNKERKSY